MLLQTVFSFATSLRMLFHGIFLLGAFYASLSLEPTLSPIEDEKVEYSGDRSGMKIDIRFVFSFFLVGSPSAHIKGF